MIEKQFGRLYGPALKHGDKAACMVNLQTEIDRRGGVPYGWMRVYEALLFAFYNPRSGECFPSHEAIAAKARCSVSTVQRALKWARENHLIAWAHGVVRHGWRVLRTSNRYAFAAFLTVRQKLIAFLPTLPVKKREDYLPIYKSLADIDAHARARARNFRFPLSPLQVAMQQAVGKKG